MIFRHISVFYNSSSQNEVVVTFLENQCWFKKHTFTKTYSKATKEEKWWEEMHQLIHSLIQMLRHLPLRCSCEQHRWASLASWKQEEQVGWTNNYNTTYAI